MMVRYFERTVHIRNRAVHNLDQPTADDVKFMLSVVREVVEKYLGEAKSREAN